MPGDFEINALMMMSTDVPAVFVTAYMIQVWKPKMILITFSVLQAISGLSLIFLINNDNADWLMPFLVAFCRFCISSSFAAVWMAPPKMFPTLFGATSMGIANIFSRAFVITAPMFAEAAFPTPIVILTVFNVITATTSCFMIEDVRDEKMCNKSDNNAIQR